MKARTVLAALLLPIVAIAQEDVSSGLFVEARHVPLVSQTANVSVASGVATVHLVQVFQNDGADAAQADWRLHLPEDASVVSFGFWHEDRFLTSKLEEKDAAMQKHVAAATSGRVTGLLRADDRVQAFTIHPLPSGAPKTVEVTLSIPIVRELGRHHLLLPVDVFLGQSAASLGAIVNIRTDGPLAELGVDGAKPSVLARDTRSATLMFASRNSVDVWWHEKGDPLALTAESVPLNDGARGVAVRVALNDAGEWRAPFDRFELFVDGSYSMRRRRAPLARLIGRLRDQSPVPLRVHAVGESARVVAEPEPDRAAVEITSKFGHVAGVEGLRDALRKAGCDAARVRCAVVSDPAFLSTLDASLPVRFVALADAHERAFFDGRLPSDTLLHQHDADAPAALDALADALVLPVLQLTALSQSGRALELPKSTRVAEGGHLSLFLRVDTDAPLALSATVDGRVVERVLPVKALEPDAPEAKAVRRGTWEALLSTWTEAWKRSPDADLKKLIVETSVREGIPTMFTSMRVDGPELSLFAIKPGDPLLHVSDEEGLVSVTAWYPFGDRRELVRTAAGKWVDRFLVPRGWTDRHYAIEVFKTFADGTVRSERTWYQLDDRGPAVTVSIDRPRALLRVLSAEPSGLASVQLQAKDGVTTLVPFGEDWAIATSELPRAFTLVARDRAGNRTLHKYVFDGRSLSPVREKRTPPATSSRLPELSWQVTSLGDASLALERDRWRVELDGRTLLVRASELRLKSQRVTASMRLADGFLFGTSAGELVRLRCEGSECAGSVVGRRPWHAITGIEQLPDARVLVGVLGEGLFELRGERLVKSVLQTGSAFVTGLAREGDDVLVGTAYDGLWRIVKGRVIKSRFPHAHVASIESKEGSVLVHAPDGAWRRIARDRFQRVSGHDRASPIGSPALTSAVPFEGTLYVGGFNRGLFRLNSDRLESVPLELSPLERQVNALAVFADRLWLGTEGGLLSLDAKQADLRRHGSAAVHDLAASPEQLAVAGSSGLALLGRDLSLHHPGTQHGVEASRFMSVAWHRGELWAGGMEGLYRFGDRPRQVGAAEGMSGGWVTALASDGESLFVGTYAEGVFAFDGTQVQRVKGLETRWVPPRALRLLSGALWVGGLGEHPAVRLADGSVGVLPVPAADVNDVLPLEGDVMLLTSEGLIRVAPVGHARAIP